MQKKQVATDAAPAAIGPYSQAVRAGDFLFLSGQIPLSPAGELVTGSIEEQTRQVLENMKGVLEAAGVGFGDVVKTTIFLADLGDFDVVNRIYGDYFSDPPPARACVEVAALPKGVAIEIEGTAYCGS